jgi:hypothetical protein
MGLGRTINIDPYQFLGNSAAHQIGQLVAILAYTKLIGLDH